MEQATRTASSVSIRNNAVRSSLLVEVCSELQCKKELRLAYRHTSKNKYTDHLEASEVVGDVRDVVPRVPIQGLLQALLI